MSISISSDHEHLFAVRLMQHLVVPTFVLDAEGKVIIWNKACERLTGVKAEHVLGSKDHWQAFYEEPRDCLADLLIKGKTDDIENLYSAHSNPDDSQHGLDAENWCTMPRATKRLYLAIDAGPIYDDSGHLIAVVETLRDMTAQKLAQNALQSLAHKDGLTGLANRRAFDDKLEADWIKAQQDNSSIALLLVDVDHFKQYNDIYGHQKGDDCLKIVAECIGQQTHRPSDLAARYGGEEFAIILPDVDPDGALQVAERVRQAVYDLNIKHNGNSSADFVTISAGVSCLIPSEEMRPKELIEEADKALYQAKHSGRNKITSSLL